MHCPRCHRQLPHDYRFCPHDGEPTQERPAVERLAVSTTKLGDSLLGDRYRVRGFVGCGGMARVYLAEDERSGRPVAVKILQPPYADDPEATERFLNEARIVARIGHPGVVALLASGRRPEDDVPYLVMEFLYGESLGEHLARHRRLRPEVGIPWMRQAASALAAAHRKGIVHRDVKPDNLFLLGEPDDAHRLKVIDFGLSKVQTQKLTAAGTIVGTPEFMAPEQVLAEPLDGRCDVYALGVVMYRTFTGRLPFEGGDDVELVAQQVHRPPRPPGELAGDIDPRLERVVLAALRKHPDHRYPSMALVFEDLVRLDTPSAPLWADEPREDLPFEPRGRVAREVAAALRRVL